MHLQSQSGSTSARSIHKHSLRHEAGASHRKLPPSDGLPNQGKWGWILLNNLFAISQDSYIWKHNQSFKKQWLGQQVASWLVVCYGSWHQGFFHLVQNGRFFVLVLPLTISQIIHVYSIHTYIQTQTTNIMCLCLVFPKEGLADQATIQKAATLQILRLQLQDSCTFRDNHKIPPHSIKLHFGSSHKLNGHTEEHLHCQGQTFEARNQIHPFELWIIHFMWVWMSTNQSKTPNHAFLFRDLFTILASCNFKETSFECVKSYCLFWVLPHLKYS